MTRGKKTLQISRFYFENKAQRTSTVESLGAREEDFRCVSIASVLKSEAYGRRNQRRNKVEERVSGGVGCYGSGLCAMKCFQMPRREGVRQPARDVRRGL